ncbi:unnamed protein product, partial [Gongylonema pulchrum]|uniref:NR LBD domain-containing protein n=1 Tax=Gongylonema pulchrum TaxID=637853 RepID=A0A183DBD7_9BILA
MVAFSWLSVHLLRVIHQYDPVYQSLVLADGSRYKETRNNDPEQDERTQIYTELLNLAKTFYPLQLDNRQLALLSAFFIYNPENMKGSRAEVEKTQENIWMCLKSITESDDDDESPDLRSWAGLLSRVQQFQITVSEMRHFFLNKEN